MRESEEKFRVLAEKAVVGIWIVRDKLIKYVNPMAAQIFKYPPEELIDKNPMELVLEEDRPKMLEHLVMRKKGNSTNLSYQFKGLTKDRKIIELESYGAPILWQGQMAVLESVIDITRRKKTEAELIKSRKMESVGILAGGIAHDFNNLLGVIMGYIELGKMGLPPDSSHMNSLSKADRAIMKARDLAQQFLTFSEGGTPLKRVVSLRGTVKKVVDHMQSHPDLHPKIINSLQETDIKINIPPDLWMIDCDPDQITQVISQLIINAAEAMHTQLTAASNDKEDSSKQKGTIEIIAENMIIESQQFGFLQPGKYIRLSIKDQGEGIKQENLSKIFDPYFSTRDRVNQKGLGLGLTLVYSIIKRHNGHIEVNSQIDKGTTVTIYLPALNKKLIT